MVNRIFFYVGSILPFIWGVAHLFPTKSVVAGFGPISKDNTRIITMEWITEGVALIFLGAIAFAVTQVDYATAVSHIVYWITFAALNVLSVVSIFTGFRVNFLPFRMCPFIFTGGSIFILLGLVL